MRTDNKATPGPWEYAQTGGDDNRFDIFQSKTSLTVARTVNNAHVDDREANARLIAAAPELLAELRMMAIGCCGPIEEGRSCHKCSMAHAAIAKATAV